MNPELPEFKSLAPPSGYLAGAFHDIEKALVDDALRRMTEMLERLMSDGTAELIQLAQEASRG